MDDYSVLKTEYAGDRTALLLFEITVVITVASQIDAIQRVLRPVMYAMWIIMFLYLIARSGGSLPMSHFSKTYIAEYVLYILYCLVCTMLGSNHMSGNYVTVLVTPLVVTLVASLMRGRINRDSLMSIMKVYVIVTLIFALYCNIRYFPSYSEWLGRNIYAFRQKNSAAQIWFSAAFIVFFMVAPSSKPGAGRTLWYVAAAYLVFVGGMSQCRTAILATAVVVIYQVLRHSKHKITWIVIFIAAAVLLWNIPATREYISQAIFLEKYRGTNLDTFSSGRLTLCRRAINVIRNNFLIGTGKYYVDMSYLMILAESGIIGFIIIETIWIRRIVSNFRNEKAIGTFSARILDSLVVFYLVESLLEGYPPFGAGVCSFMFWFLSEMSEHFPKQIEAGKEQA